MPEPLTNGTRWQDSVDKNFDVLFRYHEEDRSTLGAIQLSVQRIEDTTRTVEMAHTDCQAKELPALKAEANAARTFRRTVVWGGGVILGLLLVLIGELIKRGIAYAMPLK